MVNCARLKQSGLQLIFQVGPKLMLYATAVQEMILPVTQQLCNFSSSCSTLVIAHYVFGEPAQIIWRKQLLSPKLLMFCHCCQRTHNHDLLSSISIPFPTSLLQSRGARCTNLPLFVFMQMQLELVISQLHVNCFDIAPREASLKKREFHFCQIYKLCLRQRYVLSLWLEIVYNFIIYLIKSQAS